MNQQASELRQCKLCNAMVKESRFLTHMRKAHREVPIKKLPSKSVIDTTPATNDEKGIFIQCPECNAKLNPKNLKKHNRKVHFKPKYQEHPKTPEQDKIEREIANIRQRIKNIGGERRTSLTVAQNLIRKSAYWYIHSSGRPVLSPGHHKRINIGYHGWEISFGNNIFHIELAVNKISNRLLINIERCCKNELPSIDRIDKTIYINDIASCVSSKNNYQLYDRYTIKSDGFMQFGAQAIYTKPFLELILNYILKGY